MKACQFLGISRQAYYKQCRLHSVRHIEAQAILAFVRYQRMSHPRMGTRKLLHLINQSSDLPNIGRDRLFHLLKVERLLVPNKRAYHKTTHSHHRFRKHPNLLKPGPSQVKPTKPEQVWVADITYLPTGVGEAYLSLVTDAYSRKVVGYHVHESLKTEGCLKALKQAIKDAKDITGLIHHSDRGIQYCSEQYQKFHAQNGIKCSMTDGYDCYQNALAERVNGILKGEYLLNKPKDLQQARKMVEESVILYNQYRPHMSLEYKTPDEIHRAS